MIQFLCCLLTLFFSLNSPAMERNVDFGQSSLAAEGTVGEQLQLIKQDSIGRWWGVRGDSGQMRPIGSLETGPSSINIHGNSATSPQTAYL
jgi:hypothetical protein